MNKPNLRMIKKGSEMKEINLRGTLGIAAIFDRELLLSEKEKNRYRIFVKLMDRIKNEYYLKESYLKHKKSIKLCRKIMKSGVILGCIFEKYKSDELLILKEII